MQTDTLPVEVFQGCGGVRTGAGVLAALMQRCMLGEHVVRLLFTLLAFNDYDK